jgi:hypothetical protein
MEEDVKMLRQVLDNLLAFSLSGICDGTIQGSQKGSVSIKTSNCNRT